MSNPNHGLYLFVNDTKLFSDDCAFLQMDCAATWYEECQLFLALQKCQHLQVTGTHSNKTITPFSIKLIVSP